jgi:hypothetical protein
VHTVPYPGRPTAGDPVAAATKRRCAIVGRAAVARPRRRRGCKRAARHRVECGCGHRHVGPGQMRAGGNGLMATPSPPLRPTESFPVAVHGGVGRRHAECMEMIGLARDFGRRGGSTKDLLSPESRMPDPVSYTGTLRSGSPQSRSCPGPLLVSGPSAQWPCVRKVSGLVAPHVSAGRTLFGHLHARPLGRAPSAKIT